MPVLLEFYRPIILDCSAQDENLFRDGKAISVISFYSALLFCLLGFAARVKMNFHEGAEISTAGL
jgi:hypothetical protein